MTYAKGYGLRPKTVDLRDYRAIPPAAYTGAYVDLSAGFPDPPYDQGRLGSCDANATAAVVDFARVKQGLQPLQPPSRLFIYYTARYLAGYPLDQDTGLQIRDGFRAIAKYGAPPEADWPYADDPVTFTRTPNTRAYVDGRDDMAIVYGSVPDSGIDDVIASGWPVVIGWDVYSSFESDRTAATGIMPIPDTSKERQVGGHATVTVSTPLDGSDPRVGGVRGVAYRKSRNSWGHDGTWGIPAQRGYFWYPVSYMDGPHASDFWVLKTVGAGDPPTPPGPPPFSRGSILGWLIGWLRRLAGLG